MAVAVERVLQPIRALGEKWRERTIPSDLNKLVESTSDRLIKEAKEQGDELPIPTSHDRQFLVTYWKGGRYKYGVLVTEKLTRISQTFNIKITEGSISQPSRSPVLIKNRVLSPKWGYTIGENNGLATMKEQLAFLREFNQASLVLLEPAETADTH